MTNYTAYTQPKQKYDKYTRTNKKKNQHKWEIYGMKNMLS